MIVLNGENDYMFLVGEQSPIGIGKVKKIRQSEGRKNAYIVFLDDRSEIDIISDKVMVHTEYKSIFS